ncbi:hypothetical protein MPER_15549, partial [Moniliophthora perniciosa FA553]
PPVPQPTFKEELRNQLALPVQSAPSVQPGSGPQAADSPKELEYPVSEEHGDSDDELDLIGASATTLRPFTSHSNPIEISSAINEAQIIPVGGVVVDEVPGGHYHTEMEAKDTGHEDDDSGGDSYHTEMRVDREAEEVQAEEVQAEEEEVQAEEEVQ